MIDSKKLNARKFGNNLLSYFSKPANVITIIFLIVLTLTVIYPLISVVIESFVVHTGEAGKLGGTNLPAGSITGYHWEQAIFNGTRGNHLTWFWKPLGVSILMALLSCFIAVVSGGAIAWFITRSNVPCKKFISTVLIFPYIMPSWSIAMFWENFFKNNGVAACSGQVGLLQSITGGAERGLCAPEWMVYGFFPSAMCLGIHYAPFAYILIGGILRNMDANLEEAATVLKAGRGKILGRITLPIVAPALFSTVLLVFSSSISSYTVPAFLNRNKSFTPISIAMKSLFNSTKTQGQGYVVAIVLLLFSVAILTLNNWFTGKRKSFTTVSGKSGQISLVKLGKWRIPVAVIMIVFVSFFAIIPLISFALESFLEVSGDFSSFTTYYWTTRDVIEPRLNGAKTGILVNSTIWSSLGYSLLLSLIVAFVAGTSGILIGYASARKRGSKLATWVNNLAFFPYLIPAMSFGAVYLSLTNPLPFLRSEGLFLLLAIVGCVKFLPFASRSGTNAMLQLSGEIEEAAIMMNVPWGKRMTRVLFPIQKASLLSGYLLPFISCMRELTLYVLILAVAKDSPINLITNVLQNWSDNGISQVANGINLIIIVLVLVIQFVVNKLTGASIDKGVGG